MLGVISKMVAKNNEKSHNYFITITQWTITYQINYYTPRTLSETSPGWEAAIYHVICMEKVPYMADFQIWLPSKYRNFWKYINDRILAINILRKMIIVTFSEPKNWLKLLVIIN